MSHLPGQPHSTGADLATGQQSPHETTIRGHSAPGTPDAPAPKLAPYIAAPPAKAKPHPKKNSNGNSSSTQNAAILPDTDPWRRLRRKLMGLDPDEI